MTVTFSESAQALFRLDRPTAVAAGAGSGKTTALVELCVRLLAGEALGSPCDPGELAAITFTEKAAEELSERLRAAVAERARAARAAAPGSAEARAWIERLHGLDRMAVGTIHGFAGALLREHAVEAGLDPEFEVADEERAAAWLREAARGAVVAALDAGRPAARALVAGLGAGGARAGLADAVAELVRERATRGERAPPVPAPAAADAAEAARTALLDAARTFLAARAAASTAGARDALAAVERAISALAPGDAVGPLAPGALERLAAVGAAVRGKRLGKSDGPLRELKEAIAAAAEAFGPAAAEALGAPQRAEWCALVADAEARYGAAKRAARAVDFDDLLVLARDLLRADAALRGEVRARLRAFLVDEYQDVNPVQQEIFDLVAGPGEPAGPVRVAVGDLKQSIYRFRGADVSVFARLVARLEDGEGRVLPLQENHRSAPAILALVNEVFARCMRPPDGAAPRDDELRFGDRDRLLPTRAGGLAPACELLVDEEGGAAAERRAREARAVAARIAALVSGAAGVAVRERLPDGGERARRPRWGDVAILFRRLTQIGAYERALREAGIPYRLARGGGFYQAPEVRDLGELAATLWEPEDAIAWAAVLRSPLCAVPDGALLLLARVGLPRLWRMGERELRAEIARVSRGARSERVVPSPPPEERASPRGPDRATEVLSADDDAPPGFAPDDWRRLVRLLDAWRALREARDHLPLHELLARAVDLVDLDAALLAAPDGERRLVNVEKALALARRFAEDGGPAPAFAAHLRALAARPPREPEAELEADDAVALLSVHQAKGLEWPIAFVPDLGARPRPDGRRAMLDRGGRLCAAFHDPAREEFLETTSLRAAREDDRRSAAAESRRLLYVALTRARDLLVLSGEAANGAEAWRGLVEAAIAGRDDLARRVSVAEAGTAAAGPALDGGETSPEAGPAAVVAPRLAPAPAPAAIRIAVTELAEAARCPRRHWLGRFLGVPEPRGFSGGHPDDDPARATARGTLAHAMLAEADLAAPPLERRAQLAAAAARRGYDPASPAVRRILAEVARFADAPAGGALAAAARSGRLAREVPLLLRLEPAGGAPACYLVGAIDALVAEPRGRGRTVLDYKYAVPRAGAAERYRHQLLAYALAASRAFPGEPVRARIQFLRGDHRAVDATPLAEELARFAVEAPRIAWDAWRGAGDVPPASIGRDAARCRAEGCGYVSRCFPVARPGPAPRSSGAGDVPPRAVARSARE